MSHHADDRYGRGVTFVYEVAITSAFKPSPLSEVLSFTVHDRETERIVAECTTPEAREAALRLLRIDEEEDPPASSVRCGAW